jgi:kinetochore protein NDC80
LKNFIQHLETKRQKLSETVISLKQEFESSEETLRVLQEERMRLNKIIDNQDLSPADVDRMNAERDQLSKSIAMSGEQLDKINKQVWSKEIEIQKKMDLIERECEKFNSYLYQLDMIGNSTQRFKSLSQELEIYIQKQRPEEMCSINLRKQAKPVIHALIESIKNSMNKILDECLAIQEKIDITGWTVVNKEEEIANIQSTIKSMNQRYLSEKDVFFIDVANF